MPAVDTSVPMPHALPPLSSTPTSMVTSPTEPADTPSGEQAEGPIKHVCVVEDDPFQNGLYALILPRLLGGSQVSCFGIKEEEAATAPTVILEMTPRPEVVILDYLLDYSRQGKGNGGLNYPQGVCGD